MKSVRLTEKMYVSEVYKDNQGWISIKKKLTIREIYRMFEEKEILSISVIKDNEYNQSDYNYLTFRDNFCTLQKYFEKIVDEVKFDINLYLGLNIDLTKIPFLLESTNCNWNGIYRQSYIDKSWNIIKEKNIAIRMSLVRESFNNPINKYSYSKIKKVLYHEIGHYIHDIYFNDSEMNLSTKGKSSYARKNHKEDFAEAFMDLMVNTIEKENYRERDNQIFNVLLPQIIA